MLIVSQQLAEESTDVGKPSAVRHRPFLWINILKVYNAQIACLVQAIHAVDGFAQLVDVAFVVTKSIIPAITIP